MKRVRTLTVPVLAYWVERFGLPAERFAEPGTTAYPAEPMKNSNEIYVTQIGERAILRFDPALESLLKLPLGLETRAIAGAELIAAQGGELEIERRPGGLYSYLDETSFRPFTAPGAPPTRLVDGVKEDALLREFYSHCSEHDLDEAEILLDEPDPVIFGTFEGGKMIAYSSHRIWGENIADIGVLTHPEHRRRGLGRGVVSTLIEWHFANGVLPMYRVGSENLASQGVANALGFAWMVEIEVLKALPAGA